MANQYKNFLKIAFEVKKHIYWVCYSKVSVYLMLKYDIRDLWSITFNSNVYRKIPKYSDTRKNAVS